MKYKLEWFDTWPRDKDTALACANRNYVENFKIHKESEEETIIKAWLEFDAVSKAEAIGTAILHFEALDRSIDEYTITSDNKEIIYEK